VNGTINPAHVDNFYELLTDLGKRVGGTRQLATSSAHSGWPAQGVYFFFEPGEKRRDGVTSRVVRIGTHALTKSSTTKLWMRLGQHRGNVQGANPGGGNHRGSIFRHHVGTALLNTEDWPVSLQESWRQKHIDHSARLDEAVLERAVSSHIGAMPLLWLAVPDRLDRGVVETSVIALLSNRNASGDPPSECWLGRHADSEEVRTSGLWNVRDTNASFDPSVLVLIERLVRLV
jgi:hypothetical protein